MAIIIIIILVLLYFKCRPTIEINNNHIIIWYYNLKREREWILVF